MFTGILIEVVGLVCFSIFDKMSVYYWLNHPLIIPKRGRREKHTRINWRSSKCINPSIPIIPSINSIQSAHDPNYRFPTNQPICGWPNKGSSLFQSHKELLLLLLLFPGRRRRRRPNEQPIVIDFMTGIDLCIER